MTPPMALRRLSTGRPLPSFEVVGNEGASQSILILHGLMGNSRLWRGFAEKLVAPYERRKSSLNAVLVDLRNHGKSYSGKVFPGPHTLRSCSEDVVALLASDRLTKVAPNVEVLCGHSYGGKVALEMSRTLDRGDACQPALNDKIKRNLREMWVIDSYASVVPADPNNAEDARNLIVFLKNTVPEKVRSKRWLRDYLIEEGGYNPRFALWMSTNLRQSAHDPHPLAGKKVHEPHLEWNFNLDSMDEMINSYTDACMYDVLQQPPLEDLKIRLIKGGASDRWTPERNAELEEKLKDSKATTVHVIEGAGHWVQADRPMELLAWMHDFMPPPPRKQAD
eukprot:TRINITY_DN847_c0_g2_i1.p1 TRINITY_DN847_c0_g2~~TRINITY_DN847_c0_g2_i1.p1  ORF type:complete len:336 (-),score=39.09 TRINITY_DN847_c0_g2_i1:71-1078(-)